MRAAESQKEEDKNLRKQATLCLLIKKKEILLAMKKRGFGEGKWNGIGGKRNRGETLEEAAVREVKEEIGVIIQGAEKVAVLDFIFPTKREWDQQVVVYLVRKWKGIARETEEMAPRWFDMNSLPYEQMWWDDIHWLPLVLEGKKIYGKFVMKEEGGEGEFELKELRPDMVE